MKCPLLFLYGKCLVGCFLLLCGLAACTVEDDDFYVTRPITFIIKADKLTVEAGNAISFVDESIGATDRQWVFQGGTPATSTEVTPTVTYDSAGVFFADVTTSFEDGRVESRSLRINVLSPIQADFSATPGALQVGGKVQFNNLTSGVGPIPATRPEGDSSVLYKWVFEGTGLDTVKSNNPSVTYTEVGSYDVTLIVTRRATRSVSRITKEDYIKVYENPVTESRTARFNRDGSAILLTFNEATGILPADLTDYLSLTDANGSAVDILSAGKVDWADNIIELSVDPNELVSGTDYALSFEDVGTITIGDNQVLLAFDYQITFLGQDQDWADLAFDTGAPIGNDPRTVTMNGKEFTFQPSGVTFGRPDDAKLTVLFTDVEQGFHSTLHTKASPYTMQILPGNGASLDDLGDVAFDMSYIGAIGTTYQFSQPITDLRFHNTYGSLTVIPAATLSADGRTLTITNQGNRGVGPRITAILEGPLIGNQVTVSHNAPEGSAVNLTASVR